MKRLLFFLILALSLAAHGQILSGILAGSSAAVATPALIQSKNCVALSCTFTNPSTVGNTVIVGLLTGTGTAITSVTDNGSGGANTYTVRGTPCTGVSSTGLQFADSIQITHGGTLTVTVTDGDGLVTYIAEVSNIASFDKGGDAGACGTNTSNSLASGAETPTQGSNAFAFAFARIDAGTTLTPSYTDVENRGSEDTAYKVVGSSTTATWAAGASAAWKATQVIYNHK